MLAYEYGNVTTDFGMGTKNSKTAPAPRHSHPPAPHVPRPPLSPHPRH
jgi:hypothetical protein